jgi:heme/copper-type cytochrome/quinol oxidase subunit 4
MAAVIQLLVLLHAFTAMLYASTGRDLYAAAILVIIVLLLYTAISIAFTAGTYWPSGKRGDR